MICKLLGNNDTGKRGIRQNIPKVVKNELSPRAYLELGKITLKNMNLNDEGILKRDQNSPLFGVVFFFFSRGPPPI